MKKKKQGFNYKLPLIALVVIVAGVSIVYAAQRWAYVTQTPPEVQEPLKQKITGDPPPPPGKPEEIFGQYIVVLKDSVTDPEKTIDDIAASNGLGLSHRYKSALRGFSAIIPSGKLGVIKLDPRVAYISVDAKVSIFQTTEFPSPARVNPNRGGRKQTQQLPTGINRINAENKTNKGADVNVAVIDTGIDLSHPDLQANIVGGINCADGTSYNDGNGHGTHVAGTIAAIENSVGAVGVAPQAKLWAVRVLDNNGNGSWSSVICGIDFVTSKAPLNGGSIKVANMSLGGNGNSDNNCGYSNGDPMHTAVCKARDAGVTFVVAAGNSNADASLFAPAAYDDAVIAVSALADSDGNSNGTGGSTNYGPDDTFAAFSNYGSIVDVGAPGVNIYSTWKQNSYNTISGTSMASPHVAGAAALYIATHPMAGWIEVRDFLKSFGESSGSGHTDPSGLHSEPVVRVDAL